ncbi:hypothetical protein XELAEV_180415821mg, partial [Xenopus laevis]
MSGNGVGDCLGGEAERELIGELVQVGADLAVTCGRMREGGSEGVRQEGADHREVDGVRQEGADHRDVDGVRQEGADHRDAEEGRQEGADLGDTDDVRQGGRGPDPGVSCGKREERALQAAGDDPVGSIELTVTMDERLKPKAPCRDIAGQTIGLSLKGTAFDVTTGLHHKGIGQERIRETEEGPGQCLTVKAAQLSPPKVGHETLKSGTRVVGRAAECKGCGHLGNKHSGTQEAVCSISVRSGPWLASGRHKTLRNTTFNKRREGSLEREGLKAKHAYNRLSASRGTRCPPTTRRNRGPQQQEMKIGQKKTEARGNKRQVTVDSSKAKTSLEALKMSIKQLKWKEFPMGRRQPCDIYWHGVSFHGMAEMVHKISLSRAVRTMQELYPEEYNFYPQSWILPEEYHLFVAQNRPSVVQEYITKPLLIDKLKFDIRLYVLLKSIEPLEIYIAKDGLSRFCTEAYQEPNHKNLHHTYMHLTNYSLNLHMWSDIISLVIKTILALIPELKVYYQADIPPGKPGPTCFQILGFDILLVKNLKPVLLEVNANPSMKIDHEQELLPGVYEHVQSLVDEEVKIPIIRDTLRLVDPARTRINCN